MKICTICAFEHSDDKNQHRGAAWVILCLALALHVGDEAWNDFLSVYNPTAMAMRERLSFLPIPIFTFESWITSLFIAIVILLALTPLMFAGYHFMKTVSILFAFLMLGNGILHIAGSIYYFDWMPGVYSSPVLIAASMWLLKWNKIG